MRSPAALAAAVCLVASSASAAPRVVSLDQCADQYVLALSPRADIVALSTRARNADSYLRARAAGLPERRASSETVLAEGPQVVVRYWGGDDGLLRDLGRRGVRILTIGDATDFPGVADNIRRVAAGLGAQAAGARLIAGMQAELAAAKGAGEGRGVYYITSGGDTLGPQTLVNSMIRAAGFSNLDRRPHYSVISLEHLLIQPPSLVVLGFFDQNMEASERWSVGRSDALRRLVAGRMTVSLPGSILGCPAWFAADGARDLAAWARGLTRATHERAAAGHGFDRCGCS